MILLIGLLYLIGIVVYAFLIAVDTQIELVNQGHFYKFSLVFLQVLKKPRKVLFLSWIGVISYLTKY